MRYTKRLNIYRYIYFSLINFSTTYIKNIKEWFDVFWFSQKLLILVIIMSE